MLYNEYKDNIKSGDLIAYTTLSSYTFTGILSFLVKLFTLSRYTHVGIAIELGNRLFLISADIPEVKLEPLENTKPFYHVPMNVDWKPEYTEKLLSHIGERYSVLEAIKGYFNMNNPNDKSWFCTEFVKVFYGDLGYTFSDDMTPCGLMSDILAIDGKLLKYVDTRPKK